MAHQNQTSSNGKKAVDTTVPRW